MIGEKGKLMKSQLIVTTALGALLLAAPQTALAQPAAAPVANENELGEIVVTAQRNESTVQRTPVAISAFDEAAITSKQINDVVTLIKNVPNFSGANNVTLPTAASLFIRGIGATDSSVSADPPVGLYIDDVIVARQQLNNAGVFDLQRVEVLRGPQGTLYGRNTAAGAIKLISNPPIDAFEGWLEGGLGNYESRFGRGVVNLPIVSGKLFARANFVLTRRDGFTQNLTTGRRINDLDTHSFRGALRYIASDSVELNIKADSSRVFSQGVVGVDVAGTYVPATGDLFKVHSGDQPYNVGKTHGINGYVDWTISDALSFKSISGYRYTYQDYSFDFSDQPIPAYINASTSKTHQYSQEFQLLGSIGERLTFVSGLFYMREEARQIFGPQTFRNYSRVNGSFPPPGTPNVPRDAPFVYSEDFRLNTDSYAGYAQASYAIIDELKVEAGIRYTKDKKNFTVSAVQGPVGAPVFLFDTASVVAATGQPPRASFSEVTPHFGINYQVTPDTLIYGVFARRPVLSDTTPPPSLPMKPA
jgi:iron complex outermembrane recepter protein